MCKNPANIKNACDASTWTLRFGLLKAEAKSESCPSECPKQQRKSVGSLFHPSLGLKSFFSTESSRANPWHLAVEFSKTGQRHGLLGEELGQATHPQKEK